MTKPDPISASALLVPEVRHNRAQTIGLSSCPTDEDGKECELCAEQVDRLIIAVRDATLSAHRSALLALTPEEVVEAAARAMWELQELRLSGHEGPVGPLWLSASSFREMVRAALPVLLAPEVAKREQAERERDELRKVVAAETGEYILGYIADIRALKETLGAAHQAMKRVCPDEPEDEGVVFVCLDESGDPQVEAATIAEAITQYSEWFSKYQEAMEKRVAKLEESNRGFRENNTETNKLRIAAEAERDRMRAALEKWGWSTTTCPEGQVGCYLPPNHTHQSDGPRAALEAR